MTTGDRIRIHPHGSPERAATALVVHRSVNGSVCMLEFEDKPPFAIPSGILVDRDTGRIVMLLFRESDETGRRIGPWVEALGQSHYEIEEATNV